MIKNIEKIEKYYYPADLSKNRKPGVSAICRCKNEEEFCIPSILSVKDFFDEIIVILNNCTDKTPILLNALKLPNMKIFYYDEDIIEAGPRKVDISDLSTKSIVYYTNYCISLSSYEWIYRWDLDNIALSNFNDLRNIINKNELNWVEDRAFDIVNDSWIGSQQMVSFEKRLIRIKDNVRYISSPNRYAEQAYIPGIGMRIEKPTFFHMRWSVSNPGKYWPNNWMEIPHFRDIYNRHIPIIPYSGEFPKILIKYNQLNKDPYKLIELYHNGLI